MENVTLALAVLLGAGFFLAKLGQRIRLPAVTGYIFAGLLLGSSGFDIISIESLESRLDHFTHIALMLIAFGIGEHLEIKRFNKTAKSIGLIGLAEVSAAFLLVGIGTFVAARILAVGDAGWGINDYIALAVLFGAVSVATAPAATLLVMRELKAAGPLTTTLMAVVAIDDGLAIIFFGITMSAAQYIVGVDGASILGAAAGSLFEIGGSLVLGVATGIMIDYVIHSLKRRGEMLTIGLALLLLCGELARQFHFSSLLAGMAAGFTIVNQDHRDVRIFRALNAFEPPIYVLFFALAGAHLKLHTLATAGWIGLVYFLLRIFGKIAGAGLGARLTKAPPAVQKNLGLALVPQAGVAIGLIFLISANPDLQKYAAIITPVVLASVVLSELVGPVTARYAVVKAGEAAGQGRESTFPELNDHGKNGLCRGFKKFEPLPWTWRKLIPAVNPLGVVVFGAAHSSTVVGLARLATIFSHYHGALPMAVRVEIAGVAEADVQDIANGQEMFDKEETEVAGMGYPLVKIYVQAENVAAGILTAARENNALGIVLGYPETGTAAEFEKVVEKVAKDAPCQVIIARFSGAFHSERILVPVVSSEDLRTVRQVIGGLSTVGDHRITLLRLMSSNVMADELEEEEKKLYAWAKTEELIPYIRCQAIATEARLETIFEEACHHDLLVMASTPSQGLQRFFFGSLAEWVARECTRPLLMVLDPRK